MTFQYYLSLEKEARSLLVYYIKGTILRGLFIYDSTSLSLSAVIRLVNEIRAGGQDYLGCSSNA